MSVSELCAPGNEKPPSSARAHAACAHGLFKGTGRNLREQTRNVKCGSSPVKDTYRVRTFGFGLQVAPRPDAIVSAGVCRLETLAEAPVVSSRLDARGSVEEDFLRRAGDLPRRRCARRDNPRSSSKTSPMQCRRSGIWIDPRPRRRKIARLVYEQPRESTPDRSVPRSVAWKSVKMRLPGRAGVRKSRNT